MPAADDRRHTTCLGTLPMLLGGAAMRIHVYAGVAAHAAQRNRIHAADAKLMLGKMG